MADSKNNMNGKAESADIGAAMIAWYIDCVKEYPGGLVTQAQAAVMLDVSRMAVNRLIARGYMQAVYFPKPPDIEGFVMGQEDSTWKKIVRWFGGSVDASNFPKVVYVAFEDVVRLWKTGSAKQKCKIDWTSAILNVLIPSKTPEQLTAEYYASEAEKLKAEEQRRG
jgi:hypothetical protein